MTDLLRQEIATAAETIVVKVGTRVLTPRRPLNEQRIAALAEELHQILERAARWCWSAGAVGAGMGLLGLTAAAGPGPAAGRGAVGQSRWSKPTTARSEHHGATPPKCC